MATRKKPPAAPQATFAFPTLTAPPVASPEIRIEVTEVPKAPEPEKMHGFADQFPGEDFPTPVIEERKLRLVPPPDRGPEEDVIVEPINDKDRFSVSLVRFYGGTVATVIYTRKQLEMLLRRIPAALEVGNGSA